MSMVLLIIMISVSAMVTVWVLFRSRNDKLIVPRRRLAAPNVNAIGLSIQSPQDGPSIVEVPTNEEPSAENGSTEDQQSALNSFLEQIDEDISDQNEVEAIPATSSSQLIKSRFHCWKKDHSWDVGVSFDIAEDAALEVIQDGLKLHNTGASSMWRLTSIDRNVFVVQAGTAIAHTSPTQFPMIFKLFSSECNRGTMVTTLGRGTFLALVPSDWERDDTFAGTAPTAPETTNFEGFLAHYFVLSTLDDVIAFRKADGSLIMANVDQPQFDLSGSCLPDASENPAALFGPHFPQILAMTESAFRAAADFELVRCCGSAKQTLPIKVSSNAAEMSFYMAGLLPVSGDYVFRIRGRDGNIICGLPFRLAAGLTEIASEPHSPVPDDTGHKLCRIFLSYQKGCSVEATDSSLQHALECVADVSSLCSLRPQQQEDSIGLNFMDSSGGSVLVTLRVDRIWWRISMEGSDSDEWSDRPLLLEPSTLKAKSKAHLEVLFPSIRFARSISVGFNSDSRRTYHVGVSQRTVRIPLREFGGYELTGDGGSLNLRVVVSTQTADYSVVMARLKIASQCKLCSEILSTKEEFLQHLIDFHAAELFRSPNAEETALLERRLPEAVYSCANCNSEIVVSLCAEPDWLLQRHRENTCKRVSEDQAFTMIATKKALLEQLSQVQSLQEVRRTLRLQ